MASLPPLGIKRVCPHCSAKFYDLNQNPALCPKCGKTHDPLAQLRARKPRRTAPQEVVKEKPVRPRPKIEDGEEEFGALPVGGEDMEELEEEDDIESLGELDEIEEEGDDEDDVLELDEGADVLIDNLEEVEEDLQDDGEESKSKKVPAPSRKKKK